MPAELPPVFGAKATSDKEEIPFKPDYLYSSMEEFKEDLKAGKKTFGVPAASLSWGIDGSMVKASLLPGSEGERQTAKMLDRIAAKTPGMFVFHSLSWPESNGDTDHIVVWKDMIIVIDTKRWKSSRKYSVTAKGGILRGTVAFSEGRVKIGYALQAWRKRLPNKPRVYGIVCIAQEKVWVARDKNWGKAPFRLIEIEKLEQQLEYMLKNHKAKIDRTQVTTLSYLAKLLVKPRNVLEEIINKEALQ